MKKRRPKQNAENEETLTAEREERKEVVFVQKDGIVNQVDVKTGIQDNSSIEILKVLQAGDEVVVAPYNAINKTLKDSMQVKVVSQEELFKANNP